jgi:hypothetical protein
MLDDYATLCMRGNHDGWLKIYFGRLRDVTRAAVTTLNTTKEPHYGALIVLLMAKAFGAAVWDGTGGTSTLASETMAKFNLPSEQVELLSCW